MLSTFLVEDDVSIMVDSHSEEDQVVWDYMIGSRGEVLAYDRIIYVEDLEDSSQIVRAETTTVEKGREDTKEDVEQEDAGDNSEVDKEKAENREQNNNGMESN